VAAGYLGHFDPLLRGHAAWAVGRLGFPGAAEVLRTARRAEEDAAARGEIEAALAELAP
jgi:epoxyqueuosine reductase